MNFLGFPVVSFRVANKQIIPKALAEIGWNWILVLLYVLLELYIIYSSNTLLHNNTQISKAIICVSLQSSTFSYPGGQKSDTMPPGPPTYSILKRSDTIFLCAKKDNGGTFTKVMRAHCGSVQWQAKVHFRSIITYIGCQSPWYTDGMNLLKKFLLFFF